jgi:hypothetical protein
MTTSDLIRDQPMRLPADRSFGSLARGVFSPGQAGSRSSVMTT